MALRKPVATLLACIIACVALSGCGQRSETFRYWLTVEVDTPQGLRTGSSVIEVQVTETGGNTPVFPEASGVRSRVRGEPVAVDLPDGKALFALLRAPDHVGDAAGLPYAALEEQLGWLSEVRGALKRIPVSQYPPPGTPLPLYATLTERDFKKGAPDGS